MKRLSFFSTTNISPISIPQASIFGFVTRIIGDLVVLEKQDEFHIYEFAGVSGNEFVFMALDSKVENIKTTQWTNLPLVGTVTNTIHQMKPRRDLMKFAA